MDRRPRVDRRAAGAVAACALVAGVLGSGLGTGHAQPAPPAPSVPSVPSAASSPGEAELERAKDRYQAAEAEMADGHYVDAVRDYAAAYDLSQDPALLFKLGRAHERAGACDVALTYYARYLRDGHPTEPFVQATNERIAACGGGKPTGPPGATTGSANGSAGSASNPSASPAPVPEATLPRLSTQRKAAWIVTGSALALVALGGVLAYASTSSENDVRDLYTGFANLPPTFDASTQQRYRELVDQGRSYQHLSWAAFGAAGAAAVAAALLFGLDDSPEAPRLAPTVSPHSAGVSVRF